MRRLSTWILNEAEFTHVSRRSRAERYEYSLKRIADWGAIYLIEGPEDFALSADDEGVVYLHVWPHARYAEACLSGWEGDLKVLGMPAGQFMRKYIPKLKKYGDRLAVFSTPDDQGWLIPPEAFYEHYRYERSLLV